MKRFRMLLWLEIKKYIKAFPGLLAAAAVLGLIVCGIGLSGNRILNSMTTENVKELVQDMSSGGIAGKLAASEDIENGKEEKISAGIVIQDESKAMRLAKNMVENMDSVTSVLNIRYVDEKEGEKLLENGELVVLIIVREKTIAGIMNGENIPVEILFPEDSGYEAAVFQEFADAAVRMLSSAQAGIYSIYDFYEDYGKYRRKGGAIDRMNAAYIKAALTRETIYETEEVAATGELSVTEYYICGGLVLFALFFSMMLVHFLRRGSRDIAARLSAAGTGYWCQAAAALAGPVAAYELLLSVLAAVLSLIRALGIEFLQHISYGQIWGMVVLMLPVSAAACAFALMVCRFTDSAMAQIMILFLFSLLQGFITGCFIPKLLLPEVLGQISPAAPAFYMIELISALCGGKVSLGALFSLTAYIVLFVAVAVALEKRRHGVFAGRKES